MTTTVPVQARGDTVHALLARELRRFDVTQFFGLIGEDTVALATDLTESGVGYVATRHEGAAVAMADGYAWATGHTGVAVISRGPGLSNAATAARTASRGGRNVLIIASAAPTKGGFRPDPKGLDQAAIAAACGLTYFEAPDTEGALAALHMAMASARAGRPSVLAVATDILNGAASAEGGPAGPPTSPTGSGSPAAAEPDARAAPSPQDVARVLDVLRESSQPLVLAGRGAVESGAKAALADLAHQIGAVLGTTMLAKDLFRGHPSDIGVVGGFVSDPARPVLSRVDCVLAFGASLNSFTSNQGRLIDNARCIQIDRHPDALGRNLNIELGICADARSTAESLLKAAAETPEFHDRPAVPVTSGAEGPLYSGGDESLPGLMDPRMAALALDRILPPDGTVVLDGGGNMGFAGRFIRVSGPRHFRLSTDFGSIGLGLGIAVGVATGRRDGPTVLWVGDGGLMMGLGDLETIGRCAIPLTVVVMNDGAFGAERFVLEDAGVANDLANYAPVDLAAVANAFGIEAYTVTTNAELAERLTGLDARSLPLLLDCKIRPDIRGIDFH